MQYFDNNPLLKSQEFNIEFDFEGRHYCFYSDLGVFSKSRLDLGTHAFLKVIIKQDIGENILDLGSGLGTIGLTLADIYSQKKFTLAEINERAVLLSNKTKNRMKLTNADVILSDSFQNLQDKIFDSILLNPPIRAGKEVIYKMFDDSFKHLKQGGSLFIVTRKDQGANSAVKHLALSFSKVILLKRDKGYYIYQAEK